MAPAEPYNPLDKLKLADGIVRELEQRPCVPLPDPVARGRRRQEQVFEGAGIYAIYYSGSFEPYRHVAVANGDGCQQPIYVGKADPKGGRRGFLEMNSGTGSSLYDRLRDHAKSISDAENLTLDHFRCRYLVVDAVWITLGERRAIQLYLPIWNTVVDGFGNHDPGGRRQNQYRSDWDVVHPGRRWANKLGTSPKTADQILRQVYNLPSREELERMASEDLEQEDAPQD